MQPEYIDIHTHLNFAAYNKDREEVIKRTLEGKTWAINVGTQASTSQSAIDLAEKHEGLFAAIGLHPIHTSKSFHDEDELGEGGQEFTSRGEVFNPDTYRHLAEHPKTVAIGECGLDYYRLEADTKEKQQAAFIGQIALANEVEKPLMLHIRQAYQDAYQILKAHAKVRGNLHFFAGSVEEAKPFLDMGFTFSFTGVVTFTHDYDEVIRFLPLERIMTETDAPYVAPVPHRGKRNEPLYVQQVVHKIADIKGVPVEAVKTQVFANAKQFFALP